jgi:hypothetical protein
VFAQAELLKLHGVGAGENFFIFKKDGKNRKKKVKNKKEFSPEKTLGESGFGIVLV